MLFVPLKRGRPLRSGEDRLLFPPACRQAGFEGGVLTCLPAGRRFGHDGPKDSFGGDVCYVFRKAGKPEGTIKAYL